MIIGLAFVMKQEVVIYLIQENGVMTLSGWNIYLSFQTVGKFFLYNSSNKRRRTYAKALQSLVQMFLSWTMLVKHHVFMLVKL